MSAEAQGDRHGTLEWFGQQYGTVRDGAYVAWPSYAGLAPHFAPDPLGRLVASESESVRCEALHLRGISPGID